MGWAAECARKRRRTGDEMREKSKMSEKRERRGTRDERCGIEEKKKDINNQPFT